MTFRPAWPLRTPRLIVRPLVEGDVGGLLAYRSRADVCRYVPFEPQDAEAIAARLRGPLSRAALDAEGDAVLPGVELTASGELVGDLMLRWASAEHRCGEIGYVFSPDHAGHGYATEAVHALLHVAFDDMALHRVVARIDARNTPSTRLAARIGMRREGRLVENEWFKGEWTDEVDYGLLDREWQALHADGCRYGLP